MYKSINTLVSVQGEKSYDYKSVFSRYIFSTLCHTKDCFPCYLKKFKCIDLAIPSVFLKNTVSFV